MRKTWIVSAHTAGVGGWFSTPPCTLQHGQRLQGRVEAILSRLGYELTPVQDAHLCCGSAGSYSLLQPALARRLRDDKLASLRAVRRSSPPPTSAVSCISKAAPICRCGTGSSWWTRWRGVRGEEGRYHAMSQRRVHPLGFVG